MHMEGWNCFYNENAAGGNRSKCQSTLVNWQSAWLFSATEKILPLLGDLPRQADLFPSLIHPFPSDRGKNVRLVTSNGKCLLETVYKTNKNELSFHVEKLWVICVWSSEQDCLWNSSMHFYKHYSFCLLFLIWKLRPFLNWKDTPGFQSFKSRTLFELAVTLFLHVL